MTIRFTVRNFGFRILWLVALGCVAMSSALASPPDPRDIATLIQQRLHLMKSVAAWKLLNNRPVEDIKREQQVLIASRESAARLGINADSADEFFRIQMTAAKKVQEYWLAEWRRNPANAPQQAPDLVSFLRPEISRVGDALLLAIALFPPREAAAGDPYSIQVEGLGADLAARLENALRRVRFDMPTLRSGYIDWIRSRGVLRVATTFDYMPFSGLKRGSTKVQDSAFGRAQRGPGPPGQGWPESIPPRQRMTPPSRGGPALGSISARFFPRPGKTTDKADSI